MAAPVPLPTGNESARGAQGEYLPSGSKFLINSLTDAEIIPKWFHAFRAQYDEDKRQHQADMEQIRLLTGRRSMEVLPVSEPCYSQMRPRPPHNLPPP
ncbi:hypothetical protein AZE42_08579 [Rhizopogon vesiculosus]|uniref:Uncharacterized protein n=1 Tax=Rhizopogon vesiculosus TaxID=180088 RepID=A0A1J8Q1R1_9AGAM|nr:hypothetical protein AZE42_08579 [Rhizopogon vesiculosus]